jgi:hypothetical protein
MKSLSENSAKISINDALRLISTFHSMHAIAGRLSPIDCENSGIETIETNTFKLQVRCCASRRGRRHAPHSPFPPQCFQTPTGIKFLLAADPSCAGLDTTLSGVCVRASPAAP